MLLLCLLAVGMGFARGEKESATATGAAGMAVVKKGEAIIYATRSEFEKVTGKKLPAYTEAPVLADMVKAGKLPSVDQRVPNEPIVIDPLDEMGVYGGELVSPAVGPGAREDFLFSTVQNILTVSPDRTEVQANIAKGWELSADYKTMTVFLREGMKWHDGQPFTSEDFIFWYEDFLLNKQLMPIMNKAWAPGGEVMKVTAKDDYTVQFEFVVPYPAVIYKFSFGPYARSPGNLPFAPKHFLKNFHIKYNPKAAEEAKKAGHDEWYKWFGEQYLYDYDDRTIVGFPVLSAWALAREDQYGNRYYDRNPYYWKVDTAGRQLPYTDRQVSPLIENKEVAGMKAIGGEFSMASFNLTLDNYTLYKENEKAGGYRTLLWESMKGSDMLVGFNLTYKEDLVLAEIFNDIRFRQAMSVAINRDEINKVVYQGKGVPRQATAPPPPVGWFTEEWMWKYFAEYDPAKANALLDEMGLKWDKDHEFRLRSDGKTLTVIIELGGTEMSSERVFTLVAEHWGDVGVKCVLKEEGPSLLAQRRAANLVQCGGLHFDLVHPFAMMWRDAGKFKPPFARGISGVPWQTWYNTDGASGEEPPENIKEQYKLVEKFLQTPLKTEESNRIGAQILSNHVKQLYDIGTVGMSPQPVIIKNGLMNVPEVDAWHPGGLWFLNTIPEQWFWKR